MQETLPRFAKSIPCAHKHARKALGVLNQASNEQWSFSDRHQLGTWLSAAPSIVLPSRSASSRGMLINPLIIKLIVGLIGSRETHSSLSLILVLRTKEAKEGGARLRGETRGERSSHQLVLASTWLTKICKFVDCCRVLFIFLSSRICIVLILFEIIVKLMFGCVRNEYFYFLI